MAEALPELEAEVRRAYEKWSKQMKLEDIHLQFDYALPVPGTYDVKGNKVVINPREVKREKIGPNRIVAHELCHAFYRLMVAPKEHVPYADETVCHAYGYLADGMKPKLAQEFAERATARMMEVAPREIEKGYHVNVGASTVYFAALEIPHAEYNPLSKIKHKYLDFYASFPNLNEMHKKAKDIVRESYTVIGLSPPFHRAHKACDRISVFGRRP